MNPHFARSRMSNNLTWSRDLDFNGLRDVIAKSKFYYVNRIKDGTYD